MQTKKAKEGKYLQLKNEVLKDKTNQNENVEYYAKGRGKSNSNHWIDWLAETTYITNSSRLETKTLNTLEIKSELHYHKI